MYGPQMAPAPALGSGGRMHVGMWMIPEQGCYSHHMPGNGVELRYMGVRLPQLPAGAIAKLAESLRQWIVVTPTGKTVTIDWDCENTPLETVITQIMLVVG